VPALIFKNQNQNKMITLEPETIDLIKKELESIPEKFHKPFNSKHEGYGVLLEEVRELEQEVFFGEKVARNNNSLDPGKHHKQRIREEAVQVAAMAIRIIQELT
jgi:hypothetical protein